MTAFETPKPIQGSTRPPAIETWLAIWGMYCPLCQIRVEEALRRMSGVLDVEVDWRYMGGRVIHVPDKVGADDLVECIGRVQTGAAYQFWAAVGCEITRAVQKTWELRSMRLVFDSQPGMESTRRLPSAQLD